MAIRGDSGGKESVGEYWEASNADTNFVPQDWWRIVIHPALKNSVFGVLGAAFLHGYFSLVIFPDGQSLFGFCALNFKLTLINRAVLREAKKCLMRQFR